MTTPPRVTSGDPRDRRNLARRAPGVLFSIIATALVVLVATAFTPAQPPPPPTAEYAPEAAKVIKTAPPEQTSNVGTAAVSAGQGPGAKAAGSASPKPTPKPSAGAPPATPGAKPSASPPASVAPSPSASEKKSAAPTVAGASPPVIITKNIRQCVGDPPRQIEDTQSPPCVAYSDGKNPGATTTGVDGSTIRILVPSATGDDITDLLTFFNQRFEFYGRQIQLVSGGCFGAGSPQSQAAQADSFAQKKIFAVVGYCDAAGTQYPFFDELARKGVISVDNRPDVENEAHLAADNPYAWTYLPTFDFSSSHLGSLACTLKGQNATHAGPAYLGTMRKFGVISNTYADAPPPDLGPLKAVLAGCGIDATFETVLLDRSGVEGQGVSQESAQEATSALLDLRSKGVTTVLNLVHGNTIKQLFGIASGQGYEPEQMNSTFLYGDEEAGLAQQPPDQLAHLFGISTYDKWNMPQDEPWYQAITQVDPQHMFTDQYLSYAGARYDYHALLVLAAGIQLAGPNLTPANFAKGLTTAQYPNPDNRFHEGVVTVSPTQHSYIADATTVWWSPSQTSEYDPSGAGGGWCYVENGVRRDIGHYPADEATKLFNGDCERYGTQ